MLQVVSFFTVHKVIHANVESREVLDVTEAILEARVGSLSICITFMHVASPLAQVTHVLAPIAIVKSQLDILNLIRVLGADLDVRQLCILLISLDRAWTWACVRISHPFSGYRAVVALLFAASADLWLNLCLRLLCECDSNEILTPQLILVVLVAIVGNELELMLTEPDRVNALLNKVVLAEIAFGVHTDCKQVKIFVDLDLSELLASK